MIVSVTVCFEPDISVLGHQLRAMQSQVDHMFVVNNGSENAELLALCRSVGAQLLDIGFNSGIGFAQNFGIENALKLGASYVLLMDQDSEPQSDMVVELQQALQDSPRAAAAGPSSIDLRTLRQSFFETDTGAWPARWTPSAQGAGHIAQAAYLIASGMLLRASALQDIGFMRPDWFIDHVDTEWCFRARSKGWILLGVADASLGHRLGEKVTTIWWLRRRQVPHHSPVRNYYMFRNAVFLIRLPYVAVHWKRYYVVRLLQSLVFFGALAPHRLLRLRLMMRGLYDGLRGQGGPLT